MLNIATSLKTAAFAGLLGIGAVAAMTTSASAYSYVRCDRDGDRCVRVHCDRDGDRCWRSSDYYRGYHRGYYRHAYYGHRYQVCDRDGDRCHWVYRGGYYRPY